MRKLVPIIPLVIVFAMTMVAVTLSESRDPYYEGNVQRGAALLDEQSPGWRSKVNVTSLDINSIENCVLGKIYGNYNRGTYNLRIQFAAEQFGFVTGGFEFEELMSLDYRLWMRYSAYLERAWKRALTGSQWGIMVSYS